MDLQFALVLVIAAAAALYAARAFLRQFSESEDEAGGAACGCGSKKGCPAMSRDFQKMLESIPPAGDGSRTSAPVIDLSSRVLPNDPVAQKSVSRN